VRRVLNAATVAAILVAVVLAAPASLTGLAGTLPRGVGLGEWTQDVEAAAPAITVEANNVTSSIGTYFYGTNLTPYLGPQMTTDPSYIAKAIPQHYGLIRVPGGSEGDTYDWWTAKSYLGVPEGRVSPHIDDFAKFAEAVGGQLDIIVNYGTGTPLEAANWVEYANAPVPTSGTEGWTVNSYTGDQAAPKGYFAWLRAQRGHPAPYGVKYWEVGNEIYGGWEPDNYTNHDPVAYANRYLEYYNAMKAVDPTIKIGAVIDPGDWWPNKWNENLLRTLSQKGPDKVDFFVVHWYNYWDHSHPLDTAEVQRFLDNTDFPKRFADQILRPLIAKYLPGQASRIEITLTEWGPNSSWPDAWEGYQIWSNLWTLLVLAESLQAGYSFTNYWNFAQGDTPYSLVDPNYKVGPIYWAFDLMTHFGRGGDNLVAASSEEPQLKVYASRLKDGTLSLLVVNKSPSDIAATVNLTDFAPRGDGVLWQYDRTLSGVDNTVRTAQMQTPPAQYALNGIGASFTRTFPGYSASVIVLPMQGGTWTPPPPRGDRPYVPSDLPNKLYFPIMALWRP